MSILNPTESYLVSHALGVTGDLETRFREEIMFWQEYIQLCQSQERTLVLPRAEDSLKQAEQKLSLYRSRQAKTNNVVPLRH